MRMKLIVTTVTEYNLEEQGAEVRRLHKLYKTEFVAELFLNNYAEHIDGRTTVRATIEKVFPQPERASDG